MMWIDRRVLMIGLAVSLLANVFLLGVTGGHVLSARRPLPKLPGAPGPVIQPGHLKTLPVNDKASFQSAMAHHRDAIRTARRALRAARATVEQDIAAPTYDREKVASDFTELRQAAVAAQKAANDAVLDALAGLSQTSRATLVDHTLAPVEQR